MRRALPIIVFIICPLATTPTALQAADPADAISARLPSDGPGERDGAIESIRSMLAGGDFRSAVDKLNDRWMGELLAANRFKEVEEFAAAGSVVAARDTWRLEQLQKNRVRALLEQNKPKEALAAAKGLFFVCGAGFVPECLQLLAECLGAVEKADGGVKGDTSIVARFKLQQLAGAQTDPKERAKALADLGEPVLAGVPVDPKPFEEGVRKLTGKDDYASQYALGNLLLLSGKVPDARKAFERAYTIQPTGELDYASRGLAKVIKAEDGNLGRMNAWIISIRPKESAAK